jgi:hypothetical protein
MFQIFAPRFFTVYNTYKTPFSQGFIMRTFDREITNCTTIFDKYLLIKYATPATTTTKTADNQAN